MATKKILDLSLRSDFDETCSLPVDDSSQTWRATGAQLEAFIKGAAVQLASTTATIGATTDVLIVDTSGGAFTATLPAATTHRPVRIKKITSDYNALTVARAGSDTIVDLSTGLTSTKLNTLGEGVLMVPNGTSTWYVVSRTIPSVWVTSTMTIGAVTTAPTKGTTVTDRFMSRRVWDSLEFAYDYGQSGAGSNGSGIYLFPLPGSLTMDTGKIDVTGSTIKTTCGYGTFAQPYSATPSDGSLNCNAPISVVPYNSTNLALTIQNGKNVTGGAELVQEKLFISSSVRGLSGANNGFTFRGCVPISNW